MVNHVFPKTRLKIEHSPPEHASITFFGGVYMRKKPNMRFVVLLFTLMFVFSIGVTAYADSDNKQDSNNGGIGEDRESPATEFTITTIADPVEGGSFTGAGTYKAGTKVEVTAIPADGYEFSSWIEGVPTSSQNDISIRVVSAGQAHTTVTAKFTKKTVPPEVTQYKLTTSATAGGTVTPGDSTYDEGTIVDIEAIADSTHVFSGWTGDVPDNLKDDPTIKITMDANKSITASFTEIVVNPTQYTLLTAATAGGTVSAGGIFNSGATPSVTAAPATGYQFSGWTGDVPVGQEDSQTITITMDANKSVTAIFTEIVVNPVTYTLITNANAGGTVSAGGTFNSGATPTITATPASGYQFSGWTGDFPAGQQNNPVITITMNSNKSVTASFTAIVVNPITYILTTNTTAGGTVSAGGTFNSGATPSVTAAPATGYQFSGWTGDVPVGQEDSQTITITMNANKSVTAIFTEIVVNPVTYTLTTNANAGGTVSAGGTFNSGATPNVTATPASGYQFSGWTGDFPAGQQSSSTITIIMNANKDVTASFTVIPQNNDNNDDEDPVDPPDNDENSVDTPEVVIAPEPTPAGPAILIEEAPAAVEITEEQAPGAPAVPIVEEPTIELAIEETPAGAATLPRTGGVPSEVLFGLGGLTTLLGAALRKFKK
jgi:uncharacterized repeat protein (TIGR02543 family)